MERIAASAAGVARVERLAEEVHTAKGARRPVVGGDGDGHELITRMEGGEIDTFIGDDHQHFALAGVARRAGLPGCRRRPWPR